MVVFCKNGIRVYQSFFIAIKTESGKNFLADTWKFIHDLA
jgi:hypothetical protein